MKNCSTKIGVKSLNWTVVEENDGKLDRIIGVKILSKKTDGKMGTGEKIPADKLG